MRTAIIGGTFSPPHNGHLALALNARDRLKADRVLILPNSAPPHKFCDVDKGHRREMARLAFEGLENVNIDDTEFCREGKSYTYETMQRLRAAYPDDELFFVIGADSLRDFPDWRRPELILRNCRLAVVGRGSIELEKEIFATEEKFSTRVALLEMPRVDVSSTLVRVNYNFGFDNSALMPARVNEYVLSNGLYADFAPMVNGLSRLQKRDRFLHTYRVVLAGLEIARRTALDEREVFIACLLHDCAKNLSFERWREFGFSNGEGLKAPIVHCGLGVNVARKVFGITDRRILDAIRYHTTCRPDMSELEKLVFVADKVERARRYPEAQANYRLAVEDLESAFLAVLGQIFSKAVEKYGENDVDSLTSRAIEFYGLKNQRQEK